jgi:hypothetical protein
MLEAVLFDVDGKEEAHSPGCRERWLRRRAAPPAETHCATMAPAVHRNGMGVDEIGRNPGSNI